jgi:hypothetical protein
MDPLRMIAPRVPTVVAVSPHLNPMPARLSIFLLAAMSDRVLGATNTVGHRSMHRSADPADGFPGGAWSPPATSIRLPGGHDGPAIRPCLRQPARIADARNSTKAILAVSAESREEVDAFADAALAAGASPASEPMDHGFMYGRSFNDPDGHLWEVVWISPETIEQGPADVAPTAA